jgi:hypothetical protein
MGLIEHFAVLLRAQSNFISRLLGANKYLYYTPAGPDPSITIFTKHQDIHSIDSLTMSKTVMLYIFRAFLLLFIFEALLVVDAKPKKGKPKKGKGKKEKGKHKKKNTQVRRRTVQLQLRL